MSTAVKESVREHIKLKKIWDNFYRVLVTVSVAGVDTVS